MAYLNPALDHSSSMDVLQNPRASASEPGFDGTSANASRRDRMRVRLDLPVEAAGPRIELPAPILAMDFRPIASGCATLSASARTSITAVWVPLRHAYWAASLNAAGLPSHSIHRPQPHGIELSDRHLRHAYFFSALGWALGGAAALRSAQDIWLKHDCWQGVRRYTEDALALSDPLEGACALSLMLDGLLRPQFCGGNEVEGLVSYFDALIRSDTPASFRAATTTVARWAPRAASAALPMFEQIWGRGADDKLGIAVERLMIWISPDSDAVETNGA